jgi:hypothetical protein
MAKVYDYKKIQEMRQSLIDELSAIFPQTTIELLNLAENRLQSAIMAGLFDDDLKKDIWQKP